jgi:hypothetical protein
MTGCREKCGFTTLYEGPGVYFSPLIASNLGLLCFKKKKKKKQHSMKPVEGINGFWYFYLIWKLIL